MAACCIYGDDAAKIRAELQHTPARTQTHSLTQTRRTQTHTHWPSGTTQNTFVWLSHSLCTKTHSGRRRRMYTNTHTQTQPHSPVHICREWEREREKSEPERVGGIGVLCVCVCELRVERRTDGQTRTGDFKLQCTNTHTHTQTHSFCEFGREQETARCCFWDRREKEREKQMGILSYSSISLSLSHSPDSQCSLPHLCRRSNRRCVAPGLLLLLLPVCLLASLPPACRISRSLHHLRLLSNSQLYLYYYIYI